VLPPLPKTAAPVATTIGSGFSEREASGKRRQAAASAFWTVATSLSTPERGGPREDDGEDNVSPDLAVLIGKTAPSDGKLRVCPEIVIEVLSPGEENRRRDLEAKRDLYWRRGAAE
jgi:hypothetical protein